MLELNLRKRKILSLLQKSTTPISGKQIAATLEISLRTLQYEIAEINRESIIVISSNKGYILNNKSSEFYLDNFIMEENLSHTILKKLILSKDEIIFDEYADELFISPFTLDKELKALSFLLEEYNLKIVRKKALIKIEGIELNKRKLINYLIFDELKPIFNSVESLGSYFKEIDISKIKSILVNTIHQYGYYVEPHYSSNLFINVIIALYRMRQHTYIDSLPKNNMTKDSIEYVIAKDICNKYANHWFIEPKESDISYLAILICGQIKPMDKSHHYSSSYYVDDKFINEISEILDDIFSYYIISVNYDDFIYNFCLHIKSLIKRAKNNQGVNNEILHSIKTGCPFIYEIAVAITRKISNIYDIFINDEEIGYIGVHVGFLIENATVSDHKPNVVLYAENYYHITNNIENKLKSNYQDLINLIVVDNINELSLPHVDLIITTKQLDFANKRTIAISPFYTTYDHIEIENAISYCIKEKNNVNRRNLLLDFFDERLFFIDNVLNDKYEVINYLSDMAFNYGVVNECFKESVLNREALSSTCFFDTFAIPHGLELNANKTMCCVLISQKGIIWDKNKIHIILMITVHQNDRKKFMKIYDTIIKSLWDKSKSNQLKKVSTLDQFITMLLD